VGAIADRVRTFIPATYDALSKSSQYGDTALQNVVDTVKYRLFGTVVSATLETTAYDVFTLDVAAKVATIRIIPGGADWWSDQLTSESTPKESISYPDRIKSLWDIHARLTAEVKSDWPYFVNINPVFLRKGARNSPTVSTTGDLLTPDPADFGKRSTHEDFGKKITGTIEWTNWA